MKKWKTLHSDYLYKTPYGNLRTDQCLLPNGMTINDYHVMEYDDWVNGVVLTRDGKLVLVEQYRQGGGDFFLEIPGGKMEKDESFEEGILREVREETGYVSSARPVLLGNYMVNPAAQNNRLHIYLIREAVKTAEQNLDPTEDITIHLVTFDQLDELIRAHRVRISFFTVAACAMARPFINR
ncbi:NUDIX hydrolase [Sporolactobacillus sp. THM19-2]|uniref:NUDIX hydrolase n=1 Tax=Sporolactobacillus sp. THM19-2 TaxID=2511171 RepID=UPI0010207A0A|nr:NUDIX hydrolase [Sporolactobacillus sp. THM19-2]RYL88893.1 NUDIX hydrolase [Sporolactobacillus sp. THM19-2]